MSHLFCLCQGGNLCVRATFYQSAMSKEGRDEVPDKSNVLTKFLRNCKARISNFVVFRILFRFVSPLRILLIWALRLRIYLEEQKTKRELLNSYRTKPFSWKHVGRRIGRGGSCNSCSDWSGDEDVRFLSRTRCRRGGHR